MTDELLSRLWDAMAETAERDRGLIKDRIIQRWREIVAESTQRAATTVYTIGIGDRIYTRPPATARTPPPDSPSDAWIARFSVSALLDAGKDVPATPDEVVARIARFSASLGDVRGP